MAIPSDILTEARKALLSQPTAKAVRLMDNAGNEYRVTREEAGAVIEPSLSATDRPLPSGEPGPVGMPEEVTPQAVGEPVPATDPSPLARFFKQGIMEDLPRGARQAVDSLRVLFGNMTPEEANKRAMADTAQGKAYEATLPPETAKADTLRFLGQTAPLVAVTGGGGAIGKLPFLARTAVNTVLGATGAALMPTEVSEGESLAGKKGMQVAGGAVLGAVAEPLIMGGGKVLGGVVKKGADLMGLLTRERITKEVIDTVIPGLKSAGIDMDSMSPEVAEAIFREAAAQRIALGKINMESLRRIAKAKQAEVELTTAQAAYDPKLTQLERRAAASEGDTLLTPQHTAQKEWLAKEGTEVIPGKMGIEYGRHASKTFEEVEEALRFQYDEADKVVKELFAPFNESRTPVPLTNLEKLLDEPIMGGAAEWAEKGRALLAKHSGAAMKDTPLTIAQANRFRAELTKAAGKDPTKQFFAGKLKDAIMLDMAEATGDSSIRAAVASHARKMELLGDDAAKAILNESANADRYVSSLFGNSRKLAATKERLLNPVSTLQGDTREQAIQYGKTAWDGIRGRAYTEILDPAVNLTVGGKSVKFSGAALKTKLQTFFGMKDISKIGDTPLAKELFSPQEIKLLQDLADLGEIMTIAPEGATINTSGTEPWLADWAEQTLGGKGPTKLAAMLRVNPALVRMRGALSALEESGLAKTFMPFDRKAYAATVSASGPERVSQALASGSLAPKGVVDDVLRSRYASKAQAYLRRLVPTLYADVKEGARRLGNGESPAQ